MGAKLEIDHKVIRSMFDADPDFEIEVRTKILNSALKGRCKEVVNSELARTARKTISDELVKLVGEKEGKNWNPTIKLTVPMKSAITKEAKKVIREEVARLVSDARLEAKKEIEDRAKMFKDLVAKYMENEFNKGVAKYTIEKIEEHLLAVSVEISERLNK